MSVDQTRTNWAHNTLALLRCTFDEWTTSRVARLAGTIAYYAVSSLLALLLIIALVAATSLQQQSIQSEVVQGAQQVVGERTAELVRNAMAAAAQDIEQSSVLTTMGTVLILLYSSSRLFLRLQDSLNVIWNVKAEPDNKVKSYIKDVLFSIAAALIFGLVLLLTLLLNGVAFVIVDVLDRLLAGDQWVFFYQITGFALLVVVMTVVFTLMFRFMPNVQLPWKSILIGAAATSFLFSCGQLLLGWYIDTTNTGTIYGTAGTFVVLLLWVYVGSRIWLFGAILTYLHANQYTADE